MTTSSIRSFSLWHALATLAMAVATAGHAQNVDRLVTRRWFNPQNQQPSLLAVQAVRQLATADAEGLSPQDYQAAELEHALASAVKAPLSVEEGARLDTRINQSVVRYLNDLHRGRINPHTIGENYSRDGRPILDTENLLEQAAQKGSLESVWQTAIPRVPMYAGLRTQLQRYLRLHNDPAWSEPLPAPVKGKAASAGMGEVVRNRLVQRLVLLGDMSADAARDPASLESALPVALKAFQSRHALNETGQADRATIEQLNVSPAERAEQIAQTMERLRWAPLHQQRRMIVVNVPEFRLRMYTLTDDGAVQSVLPINVIVGKASGTRTPLFNKDMVRVEFNPYWNVPLSIARKEMVPRLQRDPGYVDRNNFEIVGPSGGRFSVTPETLADLASGNMRIRQRPGRGNALGGVKFIFPNKDNIYLHHTSSPGLFNRDDRALSHGCVRVEDPVALAKFVLQDDPQWPEQRIRQVMDKRISSTVQIKEPIPVILTYLTAVIDETGRLRFLPDVYGQDRALKQALQKRNRG
ncbi:MAG: L,D-transpeptidase family protein [Brachymonas sp.]|jgi:murein L,D-transpeptidase YcbB/YkuD|nr:L,D-transpeptidase family protein [Brachymonas sp.]MBP8820681.1 L,D-transpeptidase family protein [Brachymonas sp.]